jgi:uncharacterized membrane protein YhiD involved in acid resistance
MRAIVLSAAIGLLCGIGLTVAAVCVVAARGVP